MSTHDKLLFGNASAQHFKCPKEWSDQVNKFLNGITGITTSKKKREFYATASMLKAGNVVAGTSNRSASYIEGVLVDKNSLHFSIPITGKHKYISQTKSYAAIAAQNIFVSGSDTIISKRSSDGMELAFFLDKLSLERIISTESLGNPIKDHKFNFSAPTFIDGSKLTHNYIEAFMTIASIFDDLKCDGNEIERLGIDDLIQRTFLSLISDHHRNYVHLNDYMRKMPNERILDIVCDAVRNYSNKVMTITEMQELTGLSTHSLHAAFRKRFDCTPREWQRNEHLNRAREMLLSNSSNMSVNEVAHHQGFLSEKTFSRFYLARFGELPSETIRRKK